MNEMQIDAKMNQPLLSVCIITYNHAKYIDQALTSVLNQKADFEWEIIIADDCSTDGTPDIITEFARKYPNKIKPILRHKNVGAVKNFYELILIPKTKYIAFLEGDDFWTDDNKLQSQVDFLENNPEYQLCFHNALITYDSTSEEIHSQFSTGDKKWNNSKKIYTLEDIIEIFTLPFLTIVYRNNISYLPIENYRGVNCDSILSAILLSKGKAYFSDENMATYRIHQNGTWAAKNNIFHLKNSIITYTALLDILPPQLGPRICDKINSIHISLFNELKKDRAYISLMKSGFYCITLNFSKLQFKSGLYMALKFCTYLI